MFEFSLRYTQYLSIVIQDGSMYLTYLKEINQIHSFYRFKMVFEITHETLSKV